ncbi:unnamed protein product [Vitrella brassicaformis CCMP3155]|uniref:Uncharacterized protein n=2 Tax=Vitrella brassicaformis TaxID=1169539 RepID=A0A0G4G100_VITBC|nr:unnamed protein product [Vitrella brassicaformis CCMP3155]|eukprot:CEM21739.1 unnamed protein product [Vitrella brassicaformis CCMP3155]
MGFPRSSYSKASAPSCALAIPQGTLLPPGHDERPILSPSVTTSSEKLAVPATYASSESRSSSAPPGRRLQCKAVWVFDHGDADGKGETGEDGAGVGENDGDGSDTTVIDSKTPKEPLDRSSEASVGEEHGSPRRSAKSPALQPALPTIEEDTLVPQEGKEADVSADAAAQSRGDGQIALLKSDETDEALLKPADTHKKESGGKKGSIDTPPATAGPARADKDQSPDVAEATAAPAADGASREDVTTPRRRVDEEAKGEREAVGEVSESATRKGTSPSPSLEGGSPTTATVTNVDTPPSTPLNADDTTKNVANYPPTHPAPPQPQPPPRPIGKPPKGNRHRKNRQKADAAGMASSEMSETAFTPSEAACLSSGMSVSQSPLPSDSLSTCSSVSPGGTGQPGGGKKAGGKKGGGGDGMSLASSSLSLSTKGKGGSASTYGGSSGSMTASMSVASMYQGSVGSYASSTTAGGALGNRYAGLGSSRLTHSRYGSVYPTSPQIECSIFYVPEGRQWKCSLDANESAAEGVKRFVDLILKDIRPISQNWAGEDGSRPPYRTLTVRHLPAIADGYTVWEWFARNLNQPPVVLVDLSPSPTRHETLPSLNASQAPQQPPLPPLPSLDIAMPSSTSSHMGMGPMGVVSGHSGYCSGSGSLQQQQRQYTSGGGGQGHDMGPPEPSLSSSSMGGCTTGWVQAALEDHTQLLKALTKRLDEQAGVVKNQYLYIEELKREKCEQEALLHTSILKIETDIATIKSSLLTLEEAFDGKVNLWQFKAGDGQTPPNEPSNSSSTTNQPASTPKGKEQRGNRKK